MSDAQLVERVYSRFAGEGVVPTADGREAIHIGESDLPYVYAGEGAELQLQHVDLNQGLWISKTRFSPGLEVAKHFHTGFVYAVTLKGSWHYKEYPDVVNHAGSYLFEPAGSVHSLVVPETAGETEVWFAIYGSNVLLDDEGNVTSVVDARRSLDIYRAFCEEMGESCDKLIVVGEE